MAKPIPTPLVKTINGVRRVILYYDGDIFDEKITLSASLVIGEAPEGLFPDIPYNATPKEILAFEGFSHYNTIHDEDAGTSGTDWKTLEEIGITIYPRPFSTKILGPKRVEFDTTHDYTIDPEYDVLNYFSYEWEIINESATATINGSNLNKNVNITFGSTNGVIALKCKIQNESGCYRYIIKRIIIGIVPKSLLIVRNTYF
jgi:hypothetical protein